MGESPGTMTLWKTKRVFQGCHVPGPHFSSPGSGAPVSLVPLLPGPVQLHGWGSLRPPCLSLSALPDQPACGLTVAPTPCSPGTVPELCTQPSTASSGQALQQAPRAHIIVPVPSLRTAPPQAALPWMFKAKPWEGRALAPPQPPHAAHLFSSRTVSRFLGAPSASSLLGEVSPAPRASRPVSPPPVRITVQGGPRDTVCSLLTPVPSGVEANWGRSLVCQRVSIMAY